MRVCGTAMPHSWFLGGGTLADLEPLDTTGQVERSAILVELRALREDLRALLPSWSQADRDKALWLDVHQRETCSSCGTRPGQLQEDPASWTWKVDSCPGCELREKGQQTAIRQAKRGDPKAQGLRPWQWISIVRNRTGGGMT